MPADPELPEEIGQLKQAIDVNDVERVKLLMARNPALHRAPLGYGKDGPLTWVAECRVPWEPPGEARLAMARLAIDVNDVERVKLLMARNPALHRAPLGYGKDGPLTWVAECRVPWEPPGEAR